MAIFGTDDETPTITWMLASLLFVFSSVILLGIRGLRRSKLSSFPLPPGPMPLPILGNLLDIPKTGFNGEVYKKFTDMCGSDIVHLNLAGTSIIIIDTLKDATELLDKRSRIYSSRPPMPMICDLMGWKWAIPLMPYGQAWSARRKALRPEFHPNNAYPGHDTHITESVHNFLHNLTQPGSSDVFESHLRRMLGSLVMSITYGIGTLPYPHHDENIDLPERALEKINTAVEPGAFLVDTLPWMKYIPSWFPGASFQRKAKEWKADSMKMLTEPYSIAKGKIANGSTKSCFISNALARLSSEECDVSEQEQIIREAAGAIYLAAADTMYSTLLAFFLAMVCYPEIQARAQEKLDEALVVPNIYDSKSKKFRTPDLKDRYSEQEGFVYITAVMYEVLRWQPVTPVGVPHYTTEDDEYKGYHIPKNSIVFPNIWSMLHDEKTYAGPYDFNPDRWIKNGKINPDMRVPHDIAFGFGRRICPGRQLALSNLWLTISSILASFNISKAVDKSGATIDVEPAFDGKIHHRALPFKCSIKPRSNEYEELLHAYRP